MTIRNKDAYMGALWDWGFLDNCFVVDGRRTGIKVSDIDGIVERNGYCLVIEAKGPGVPMTTGQRRMHKELVKKGFAVLVLWGETNKPQRMQVWYPYQPQPRDAVPAGEREVQGIVARWFNWANANGNVSAA